jgi:hypothetical protein
MICYRDTQYCRYFADCALAEHCEHLTKDVEEKAAKAGLPVDEVQTEDGHRPACWASVGWAKSD